ncbi:GtrA family protein [Erwinia billingiae]|uniref:GtrA family protein n=1 Tax=Erwinia billingiae TaxID=182337 RepID=UPI000D00A150|nr:GtrA family protein [Erwinia billingiae]PRB58180.1 polysaccharide synthesis protein GtrA [Erwinia billingiae]
MKVIREIILFGLVGALGFLIDSGVLYLLKDCIGLYTGRAVSFICAVVLTWFLNRSFTFKQEKRARNLILEFTHYFMLMLIGGCFNIGVYYIMVHQSEFVNSFPIIGVAVGSIVGMFVNFISSRVMFYSKGEKR